MIVYDNVNNLLALPDGVGIPREDQLVGTPFERLCEFAGRICYDSIGTKTSRNSTDYHKHIIDVGHGSVWEHANFVIELTNVAPFEFLYYEMLNRPGLFVTRIEGSESVRLSLNLRTAREWNSFGSDYLGPVIRYHANKLAPNIVQQHESDAKKLTKITMNHRVAEPINDNEKWITAFLIGSRGFSHELVRHGDWTAISQRSTRFCNESESVYCQHPLFIELATKELKDQASSIEQSEKQFYDKVCTFMKPLLEAKGLDKLSSLKQSRGAARGFLANNLSTEIVFSASMTQWNRIFKQRVSPFADREINDVILKVKEAIGG